MNGYEGIIDPPQSRKDIAYWLNYEIVRRGITRSVSVTNAAIEESSVGLRSCCRLLGQDQFIRSNITTKDILIVSLGGNDIALRPNLCTIIHMLTLIKCCSISALKNAGGSACPCDEYCGGCTMSSASDCLAWPCCYGYFLHLFGTRIQAYLENVTSKTRPKAIVVCMIYYPDEVATGSWADATLGALGYNSNPEKLQALIDVLFRDATSKISIPGTKVIPVALSKALDGKNTEDYSQRVEPSAVGGAKMATLLMDTLEENGLLPSPEREIGEVERSVEDVLESYQMER